MVFASSDTPWCPILGQHGWDPNFNSMKVDFLVPKYVIFLCTFVLSFPPLIYQYRAFLDIIKLQMLSYFQAHFNAYGPSFKDQHEVDPFENIELYNLLAGD